MQLEKHLYLIGFMGVGKTTTSKQLSKKLDVLEVDTDAMIVEREKRPIAEIFSDSGEDYFRRVETGILDLLAEYDPCVVSCGGGMAMRQVNVDKMKQTGLIVFLTADPETIYQHVKDSKDRPLLNGNMNIPYITKLMEAREPQYQKAADIIIKTDGYAPFQIADQIIEMVSGCSR